MERIEIASPPATSESYITENIYGMKTRAKKKLETRGEGGGEEIKDIKILMAWQHAYEDKLIWGRQWMRTRERKSMMYPWACLFNNRSNSNSSKRYGDRWCRESLKNKGGWLRSGLFATYVHAYMYVRIPVPSNERRHWLKEQHWDRYLGS